MSIRTVDPNCRYCHKPLRGSLSKLRRVGPDCWSKLTAAEKAKALDLAEAERDPFRIPAERAPSVQARVNNHNARAAAQPDGVQLCHHENRAGACPACRRERDPWRAAEMILRAVRAEPFAERRVERARVLAARYAHVTPWRAPERAAAPRTRPTPTPRRPARSTRPTGQLELL